jgi:hypothetical protein
LTVPKAKSRFLTWSQSRVLISKVSKSRSRQSSESRKFQKSGRDSQDSLNSLKNRSRQSSKSRSRLLLPVENPRLYNYWMKRRILLWGCYRRSRRRSCYRWTVGRWWRDRRDPWGPAEVGSGWPASSSRCCVDAWSRTENRKYFNDCLEN